MKWQNHKFHNKLHNQYMNLSLNLLKIHSINSPILIYNPNGYPKCRKIEPFLIMDPCHSRHSKSLPVHEMRLDFLQLICNLDANGNWLRTSFPFSRFSHEAGRNMNESSTKACATNWPHMEVIPIKT